MRTVRRMKPIARLALDDLSEGTPITAESAMQLIREIIRGMPQSERDRFIEALGDLDAPPPEVEDEDDPEDVRKERTERAADRRRMGRDGRRQAADQRPGSASGSFADRWPAATRIRVL